MLRPRYYILNDDKTIRPVKDVLTWARWFEDRLDRRVVAHTMIDEVFVSTIFLGLDHNFRYKGPPIVFETMIIGGEHDRFQSRSSTWDEALRMHKIACGMIDGKVVRFANGK
jgi:hypothetical protein